MTELNEPPGVKPNLDCESWALVGLVELKKVGLLELKRPIFLAPFNPHLLLWTKKHKQKEEPLLADEKENFI